MCALPRRTPGLATCLLGALLVVLTAGCSSWRPAGRYAGWTLYVRDGELVDEGRFERAFAPAIVGVEERLGPFEKAVRVHAWNGGVELTSGNRGEIRTAGDPGLVQDVPGIGPARVRAFHARGGGGPFALSGVFIGEADVGTAVHELVHARLAELDTTLPLWFEEGLASLLADGAIYRGRWVVDGLACWPLRELSEEELSDDELEHLLRLTASEDHSVRDNLLVHFVGWAIVFDLYREDPGADWSDWLAAVDGASPAQLRARMERTLDEDTPIEWVQRLGDPHPGVRLATVRGIWKLASPELFDHLVLALHAEEDPEVQLALAINALAGASSARLSGYGWSRLRRALLPVLRDVDVPDADETEAARVLHEVYRYQLAPKRSHSAFEALSRYWEE